MICYEGAELQRLFEAPKRRWIVEEISRRGYSPDALRNDKNKMLEIVSASKLLEDKEEVEIFSALYLFPQFYPDGSKVCFLLKDGLDPVKNPVDSLEKLKKSLKEKDLSDFGLLGSDGLRMFQLKAYRGANTTKDLLAFLGEKLLHYANNMGDVNFLIILQTAGDIGEIDFKDLHKQLKTIGLKGGGHILISYNEENKFDVMNTIFPDFGTTRIPFKKFAP
ncbi:MAG: hypothetical protein Q7S47_02425 [bacterium]|nr:hypothetical protein [bacterium]